MLSEKHGNLNHRVSSAMGKSAIVSAISIKSTRSGFYQFFNNTEQPATNYVNNIDGAVYANSVRISILCGLVESHG